jgi:sialic acid synthase SpsE
VAAAAAAAAEWKDMMKTIDISTAPVLMSFGMPHMQNVSKILRDTNKWAL